MIRIRHYFVIFKWRGIAVEELFIDVKYFLSVAWFAVNAASFGSQRCTWGPAYWCDHPVKAKECGTQAVNYCIQNEWSKIKVDVSVILTILQHSFYQVSHCAHCQIERILGLWLVFKQKHEWQSMCVCFLSSLIQLYNQGL